MIPVGYMAKQVKKKPDWLQSDHVVDVYSVSSCVSDYFADYISFWKHNRFWLFDSPEIIKSVAEENSIDMKGATLFYYEVHEQECDGKTWMQFQPESSFPTHVLAPDVKRLEGFDVVTFYARNSPECSPLSCNGLAREISTNSHCLLNSFEDAFSALNEGAFAKSEPGPYRIFAVYSVEWMS